MKISRFLLASILLGCSLTVIAHPGRVVNSFKTPHSFPTGLAFDGQNLWIADHQADKLSCINPKTGKTIREIPSPGFWPMGLAWDGRYLWNIDSKQKKIFRVEPSDGTIVKSIDAPSSNPEGLAWDGQTLWVSDARSKELMKIDLSDGTAVQTIPAPALNSQGLAFDGTFLWCSDRRYNEIYMLDPGSGEVILVLKSPGPYPRGLAWDGKFVWNVDYQTDHIYQLVREDDELYTLSNPRHALVTFTHQVKPYGKGMMKNLDVYIAIPNNLPQIDILNVSFQPAHYKTVSDRWDQKCAWFHYTNTPAESSINTIMQVEAKISAIDYYIFPNKVGTLEDIPSEIKKKYTADGSKYQLSDAFMQKTAADIVGSEKNPYWMARRIFNYVRETLEYKLEGGWNVAPVVLQRGTGSCSEYSFSFIALCREVGLPARFVGSIVVRGDDASLDDVFHRWPEIYLPNYGWIPIDPQGGDKVLPRDRAMNIGHLSNRFLITTQGGGDSKYLGWYYISNESYMTDPQVQVNIEAFATWQPIEK